MIRASIIGGSGYVGGQLLPLLLFHPAVEVAPVTFAPARPRPSRAAAPGARRGPPPPAGGCGGGVKGSPAGGGGRGRRSPPPPGAPGGGPPLPPARPPPHRRDRPGDRAPARPSIDHQ